MSQKIIAACIVVLFLFTGCDISSNSEEMVLREEEFARTVQTVEVVNRNSNFGEYPLLDPFPSSGGGNYYGDVPSFSAWVENEEALNGSYGIYIEDAWCISQITVLKAPYHVYGIHIGDTLENAYEQLLAWDFQKKGDWVYQERGRDEVGSGWELNGIHIDLHANADTLELSQITVTIYDPFRPEVDGAY